MKNLHHLKLAATLAAVLSLPCSPVGAEESATVRTDPGFTPNSGQINPGVEQQAPSQSSDIRNIPTPEEARAALLTPASKEPSTGDTPAATTGTGAPEKQQAHRAQTQPERPTSRHLQDRSDQPAKPSLRNFPGATTSLIGCRSWHSRCHSPTSSANRSMMR